MSNKYKFKQTPGLDLAVFFANLLNKIGNFSHSPRGEFIELIFDNPLTPYDISYIEQILADPTKIKPEYPISSNMYPVNVKKHIIKSRAYQSIIKFIWAGSTRMGPIKECLILCRKDKHISGMDLRLIDKTNKVVLAELTGIDNGPAEAIVTLDNIINQPKDVTVLEFQTRYSSPSTSTKYKIYIEDIVIVY